MAQPVTEEINASQAGEGLYLYITDAGPNYVLNFGGREECAAALCAQGIGPVDESLYPYRGAEGRLAYEDLLADKEAYIALDKATLKAAYYYYTEDDLQELAEEDYEYDLELYSKYDAYSPLDDWSINDPDTPVSGKLLGSKYTLMDNNVINYWCSTPMDYETDYTLRYYGEVAAERKSSKLYQGSIRYHLRTHLYSS